MCFIVLPDLSNDFFSFFSCIGNYRSYNGFPYGNYHYYLVQDKLTTPRSATNTVEAFNHNVKESYDMAMYKSTQTHPKFKWRFFSCQQSKYFSVEATSEQEARSMLPDSPCLFSARIRKEVAHG
ncbi:MAG: host cell division inhibitor Icd-like protein [Proteus vulgaris]|uniref:host cell division inhibitor Icd-like protein n=3 Tax=Proteus mirabilis TaxID=584 RepID=UPI00311AD6A8